VTYIQLAGTAKHPTGLMMCGIKFLQDKTATVGENEALARKALLE